MQASEAQFELPIRVAAGGLTVAGLAICHTVALSEGMIFFVLPMICATLVLLTRAQGGAIGCGVGVVAGLSLAIALTAQTAAPLVNQLAFTMVAVTITGLLGYVGGCWQGSMIGRSTDQARGGASAVDVKPVRQRLWQRRPAGENDGENELTGGTPVPHGCGPAAVAGLSADFCAWLDDENVSWAAFDQFVRGALRARLGAACVRCFHVGRDFSLEPLTEDILRRADSTLDDRIAAATPTIPSSLLRRLV
ncbi:MAG: hypothetical protein IID33_03105, partial [Planctomycetes bacterium]|nr:hypothetical protein [Planctomycetota bacterium]